MCLGGLAGPGGQIGKTWQVKRSGGRLGLRIPILRNQVFNVPQAKGFWLQTLFEGEKVSLVEKTWFLYSQMNGYKAISGDNQSLNWPGFGNPGRAKVSNILLTSTILVKFF